MTWAPVSSAPRRKVKRYTKRLLHRLLLADLAEQALVRRSTKAEVRRMVKADERIDSALEGCEDW